MGEGIKDKVERLRFLANAFSEEDKRVFIKDIDDNYYFGDIVLVGKLSIVFYCFGPDQRKGDEISLYWVNIKEIKEYKELINESRSRDKR